MRFPNGCCDTFGKWRAIADLGLDHPADFRQKARWYLKVQINAGGISQHNVNFSALCGIGQHSIGIVIKLKRVYYKKKYAYFKEKRIELELTPLEVGEKIELDPIFFAQSKATILERSFPALDKLAEYLKENAFINIRITGHTDNRGTPEILQRLSDDRAKAVKDYLVYRRHINPLRIEALGMGASQPVNDNSSERLREQNRRVEVEISEITKPLPLGMQGEGDK